MRRTHFLMIPVLLTALVAPGCGTRESKLDLVRAAIRSTQQEATQFVYTDERASGTVRVAGVYEDDFRYKALVSFDGKPAYEQIVSDDTLAVRFLDSSRIVAAVDRNRLATADRSTEIEGADAIQVLQSGRWVSDPNGAPPVAVIGASLEDVGQDPVFDALTALAYVDTALGQGQSVDEWRKDALDPAYRSSEDSFPKPEDGSRVKRYDVRRPRLPGAASVGGSGGIGALPSTRHFRKMAIYTKDDRVLRVLEHIEVKGKSVDDLASYFTAMLRESKAPKSAINQVENEVKRGGQSAEVGRSLLDGISRILSGIGEDPLLVRNMSLELDRSGDPVPVVLPFDNVVTGSLDVLLASAAAKKAAATATGGDAQSGTASERTPATDPQAPATDPEGTPATDPPGTPATDPPASLEPSASTVPAGSP